MAEETQQISIDGSNSPAAAAVDGAAGDEHTFPPPGFVRREEAARMLNVTPGTFMQWCTWGIVRCGEWALPPKGPRCKIYPLDGLEEVRLERARAKAEREANRPVLPEGFVDIDGACAIFDVTVVTFGRWQREGRIPQGQWGRSPTNKPCRIFEIAELQRSLEQMRADDKPFRDPQTGEVHLPAGMVRMQDAWRMFGVEMATWQRWEREGVITCGKRAEVAGGPKIYPLDELKRLLEECGKYSEPYTDPVRPGVYRVPLSGRDICRREAIIDAADLPLIQGRSWHWSDHGPHQAGQVVTALPGDTPTSPKPLRMRQLIMGVSGIQWRVGHRNGDPLDCRRANLFMRTKQEQCRGARKYRTKNGRPCSSRFKGLCWDKDNNKWRVGIKVDGKNRCLGRHRDEIAAAEVYDAAARELFGEYAKLNFPNGVDAWLEEQAQDLKREAA